MTVAAASLQNLIPNVPKWDGFTTAPIRVPAELKNWVIDMVNQKVQELRIMIGADTPAEQSEQQWINETLGLPAEYQPGDPLPCEVAAAVAESKAERVTIPAEQVSIEQPAVAASVITAVDPEPLEFTRDWLDWAARKDSSFNEPGYISDVKEEAAGGDPSAKRDLARLVADGVDIGEPLPSQKLTKKQRKDARRLERQQKAAGGKLQTSPTVASIISSPEAEEYYKILPVYREQAAERLAEYNAFFDELERDGLTAKIRRFKGYLAEQLIKPVEAHLSEPPLSLISFLSPLDCREYRDSVNATIEKFSKDFYSSDKQREEGNLDGRFYQIMREIVVCWYWSAVLAEDS